MMMLLPQRKFLAYWLALVACASITSLKTVEASSVAGQETLIGVVGRDFVLLGADSSMSQSIAVTASNLDKIAILVDPNVAGKSSLLKDEQRAQRQQTVVAAAAGDSADADRLIGLLSAHAAISEYEAGVGCDVEVVDLNEKEESHRLFESPPGLSVTQVAYLARGQIASALRSRQQFKVCLLVAGMVPMDENDDKATQLVDQQYGPSFVSKQVQYQVKKAIPQVLQSDTNDKEATADSTTRSPSLLQPRLYWLDEYGSLQKLQYGAHGFGSNFCLSILDQGYRSNLSRKEAEALIRDCFEQLRTRYVINSPQPPCIKCVDATGCRLVATKEEITE